MEKAAGRTFVLICIAAFGLFLLGLTAPDSPAARLETKRVFVLNSYHQGYPFSDSEMHGINDVFVKAGIGVETYFTYMDLKRISPTPQYFAQLARLIREGYKGVHFNAVIVTDNDALEFMRKYRDDLFPGVPVVFCGINDFDERLLDGRRDITGTVERNDYAGTISVALKLRPATKNIVVVTDNTTTGRVLRSEIGNIRHDFPHIGFTYLSLGDMTLNELAQKLSELSSDNIVLLLHHSVDKNGTDYSVKESASLLAKSASALSFVVNDSRIGFGALGGDLVNGYSQGETAAKMVLKILDGTDVKTIPALLESPNKYMFDYRVMQRFKIAESDLPQGSIIINKPVSVLEAYRNALLLILGCFVVLCGFVFYLLFEIRRRKLAEKELNEISQRLQLAASSAKLGIWDWDIANNRLVWDDRMLELYGLTGETFSGDIQAWQNCLHPEDRDNTIEENQAALRGEKEWDTEFKVLHPNGTLKHIKANGIVLRDAERTPVRMLGVNFDLTEQRKLEAQLMQAQKMEAIGQLAGGVAHDFNNILAVIVGVGYLLELQLKDNKAAAQYLSEIMHAAERASVLTQSLLAFSRRQHSNPQTMDLNVVVKQTEKILARTIGEDIQLSLQLTEMNTAVLADSNQITQVLINLAANSRDAMPRGGALTIATERVFLDEAFMKLHGCGSGGDYILMTVTDRGTGMDAATRKRIFEPFFTTKEVGKGTGLGLSMVYGILKQHGGIIDVYSEKGMGTTFKIYLPALEATAEHHEPLQSVAFEGATETILLVEDDDMLRHAIRDVLQEFGHTVIEACDGEDAIEKFMAHKDDVQLALMDIIMPRKSGGDAYQELKAIQPDLKIIFMSGYAGDYLAGKVSMGDNVSFIEKPISPKKLFEMIRTVLD